jgi:hypothetical protein
MPNLGGVRRSECRYRLQVDGKQWRDRRIAFEPEVVLVVLCAVSHHFDLHQEHETVSGYP